MDFIFSLSLLHTKDRIILAIVDGKAGGGGTGRKVEEGRGGGGAWGREGGVCVCGGGGGGALEGLDHCCMGVAVSTGIYTASCMRHRCAVMNNGFD